MPKHLHDFEPEWAAWCADDRDALRRLLAAPPGVDRVIADDGDTLLHLAVRDGNLAMLEFLLALRCPRSLASFDERGRTPLHTAVESGRTDLVMCLLRAGADPNAHDQARIGNTPIREAVYHGHIELVALLLRVGADPTIPGWLGISAVDQAHHDVRGGLDGPAALAIQRLLAPFPSRLRRAR